MVLRKITIDNSVKYVPITEKNTTKNKKTQPFSGGGKQDKKFSKSNKKLLKILQLVDLEYLQNRIYMYKIL